MRLLLTTIILTMLAQPVWAQTVYYCVMTEFSRISADNLEAKEPQRFKMSVDLKEVKFAGGYLNGVSLDVTHNFVSDSGLLAKADTPWSTNIIATFKPPNLYLSSIFIDAVDSFHATCEKF
jgi:hypothetical protein